MSADNRTTVRGRPGIVLPWYYFVLFGVVTLVALSMTWWSMYDLAVLQLSVPVLLAAGLSLTFDIGGVYLGLLSIEYAKTEDSGFLTELGTYAFIGTSTYIVAQHAILLSYPTVGVVLFASAPVIVGIMLKVTLNFITRQARKQAGRITEKLPSVGILTWLRYAPQSFRLMSVAMQGRLINAADRVDIVPDRHSIFVRSKDNVSETDRQRVRVSSDIVSDNLQVSVQEKDNVLEGRTTSGQEQDIVSDKKALPGQDVRKELPSIDTVSLPVWLPLEPTMSLSKLSRICLDNGVSDTDTVYRYALVLKGQDVNKTSLSRTMSRERTKMS